MKRAIIFLILLLSAPAFAEYDYDGTPTIPINDNVPSFSEEIEYAYVEYSELDLYGRVGPAVACIGQEFPIGARSSIAAIQPSGWQNKQYAFIPGGYLYNRSHLIAHRFSGGGEVSENLFTGTQYLNQSLMATIETVVADYIERTGNHVLYRVTPDFRDDELVCRGVEIEAQSVEDEAVRFHIYVFNIQPGVAIDYRTGDSRVAEYQTLLDTYTVPEAIVKAQERESEENKVVMYVLNVKSKRFHLPSCHAVTDMKTKNRKDYTGTREELISQGYKPCGECKP